MKALVAPFFRVRSHSASTSGVICLGLVVAVLSQTTSPDNFAASKREGESAAVLGWVNDHSPAEPAYAIEGLRGGEPLFVLTNGDEVPGAALVISLGHRSTTDAGRAVLIEDKHWFVPLHWVPFRKIVDTLSPVVPFSAAQASWVATAAALIFVLIVARKSARLLSAAFLVMTSLITGITLARASVEHGLITATMLPFGTVCAATSALTLVASRLKR